MGRSAFIAPRWLGSRLALCLLCASWTACSGSEVQPKTQDQAAEQESDHLHGISASSEIGGLNEDEVDRAFKRALAPLETCLAHGAERLEFLGGSVAFFLKIDAAGRIEHAHLERSTLGDRETEKCMFGALRAQKWPKPVGGQHGLARKSFEFDAPNDVRPPTELEAEAVSPALEDLEKPVRDCKNRDRGRFEATVYLATDGSVLAASVTPPDETGEANVDCLVDALRAARFSSPGSWPGKVTFSL